MVMRTVETHGRDEHDMDDADRVRRILIDLGEDAVERNPGWFTLQSEGLDLVVDVDRPFIILAGRLSVAPTPFDTLLGWVNSISSVLVASQPHVQLFLGAPVVHYGVEQLRPSWSDDMLRERIADFLRDSRRHAEVVRAVAARPGDPQPYQRVGEDGVMRVLLRCPRDHCALVHATQVTLERRTGGAADAAFVCPTCGLPRRRSVSQRTADRLRRMGATDPLTDAVIGDFIAQVARVDDIVGALTDPS